MTKGNAIHAAAIATAVSLLAALISGALATTSATLPQPSRTGIASAAAHVQAGTIAGLLAVLLLAWVAVKDAGARLLGWTLIAVLIGQGLIGSQPAIGGSVRSPALLHAILAQVLAAGLAAVVIATSPLWKGVPELVSDYGWPSLRSLGTVLPFFVLLQVGLGAAYRHQMMGLMSHIVGAMLISLLILIVCAFTLQQCATHAILRGFAKALMAVTFGQVFLGIAAFTVRAVPALGTGSVLAFTSAHVAGGALTLAGSVALSMQIRRHVLPRGTILPQAPSSRSSAPPQPDQSTAGG